MTTKVAHTPGPWSFEPSDSGDPSVGLAPTPPVVFTCIPNREERTIDIAVIGSTIYDNSEDGYPQSWGDPDANGRLIAAAPRLLDALKGLVGLIQLQAMDENLRQSMQSNHRYVEALEALADASESECADRAKAEGA